MPRVRVPLVSALLAALVLVASASAQVGPPSKLAVLSAYTPMPSATAGVRPNRPPSVRITSPANDTSVTVEFTPESIGRYYKDLALTASASDPESDTLTYTWTDSINGGPATVISREPAPRIRLYTTTPECGTIGHDIAVTVSDGHGNRATDWTHINLVGPPC